MFVVLLNILKFHTIPQKLLLFLSFFYYFPWILHLPLPAIPPYVDTPFIHFMYSYFLVLVSGDCYIGDDKANM